MTRSGPAAAAANVHSMRGCGDEMNLDQLLEEEFDLVHVGAAAWGDRQPRTPSLVRLQFDFFGLALPLAAARRRQRSLDRHGVSVLAVPVRYRPPRVSLADAAVLAGNVVRQSLSNLQGFSLGPPGLYSEHPVFATFLAPCPEMEAAGTSPPGVVIVIDRCDGHAWSDAEVDRFLALTGRMP